MRYSVLQYSVSSNNLSTRWYVLRHHCVGANHCIVTNDYRPENFCPGSDVNSVSYFWRSHDAISIADCHLMANDHIITECDSAADHDTERMR